MRVCRATKVVGMVDDAARRRRWSHCPLIREATGIAYDEMLFFDDSSAGATTVAIVAALPGRRVPADAAGPPVRRFVVGEEVCQS